MATPLPGKFTSTSSTAAASNTTAGINTSVSGSDFLVFVHSSQFNGNHSVTDNKGNTYTQQTLSGTITSVNGDRVFLFACENGAGGPGHTFTLSATLSSGTFNPLTQVVVEVTGALSSGGLDILQANAQTGSSSSTVPASTGTTSVANELVLSFAGGPNTGGGSTGTITGGYTSLFNQTSGNLVNSLAVTYTSALTTGTYGDSFTANQADDYTSITVSIKPTLLYGDGSSTVAPVTSAATGTNGKALPAIGIGQQVFVVVYIRSSSLPTSLTINDGSSNNYAVGGGPFGSIDSFLDNANGCIWYLFRCTVATPLTTPVITATPQSGYFPTSMSIAAGILVSVSAANPPPLTAANVAHSSNLSGLNQVSGFTPVLAGNPGNNYTLLGLALDQGATNATTAPAAGSGFIQFGTAWSPLSSGGTTPTLLMETQTLSSGGSPVQSTAVYVASRAYTFAVAFNNTPLPIPPAGPMPKQLYIMP